MWSFLVYEFIFPYENLVFFIFQEKKKHISNYFIDYVKKERLPVHYWNRDSTKLDLSPYYHQAFNELDLPATQYS